MRQALLPSLILSLTLAGCTFSGSLGSSGRSQTPPSSAATATARTTVAAGTKGPAPTSATAVVSPRSTTTQPSPGPPGLLSFETPSHNIACYVDSGNAQGGTGGEARCDIQQADWTPPPKPASCKLAWGSTLFVTEARADFGCVGDTAGNDNVVPYGTRVTRGSFACDVETSGVTCTDTATSHGFSVSRESYRLF